MIYRIFCSSQSRATPLSLLHIIHDKVEGSILLLLCSLSLSGGIVKERKAFGSCGIVRRHDVSVHTGTGSISGVGGRTRRLRTAGISTATRHAHLHSRHLLLHHHHLLLVLHCLHLCDLGLRLGHLFFRGGFRGSRETQQRIKTGIICS